jgi:hypothetical protein
LLPGAVWHDAVTVDARCDEPPRAAPDRSRSQRDTRQRAWGVARLLGGGLILGVIVWRVGTAPFVTGVRTTAGWPLAAAAGITALTTVCCTWRWVVVARGLGDRLPVRWAFAAYYRSQFLNVALPGGVLGDMHRGVDHGRDIDDVGRGLRAVVGERVAGQAVQVLIALVVLSICPSPVRAFVPLGAVIVVAGGLTILAGVRHDPDGTRSSGGRGLTAVVGELCRSVLAPRSWPSIVLASTGSVVGHTAVFLLAVRVSGTAAPITRLLPLAMLVLLAMVVPTGIAGWGPREGMAAWVFGAAGLGAAHGLSAATAYGLMSFVATLPGVAVIGLGAWQRAAARRSRAAASSARAARHG